MTQDKNNVAVNILGKIFSIKCPADKVSELHDAAEYLNEKVNEIHSQDKVINIDNLVVISALNIAYELLVQKKHNQIEIKEMSEQINNLSNMITQTLSKN